VKRYDDETNLQAHILVDASGSMNFGLSTVTKWHYAQMASASLAHLLLRQRDSVGLAIVKAGPQLCKTQPRSNHLARLLQMIGSAKTSRTVQFARSASRNGQPAEAARNVIVLSDCFGNVEELKQALQQYVYHGHDVLSARFLRQKRLTFPFRRDAISRTSNCTTTAHQSTRCAKHIWPSFRHS